MVDQRPSEPHHLDSHETSLVILFAIPPVARRIRVTGKSSQPYPALDLNLDRAMRALASEIRLPPPLGMELVFRLKLRPIVGLPKLQEFFPWFHGFSFGEKKGVQ
jgi:hypothetical protein